MATPLLATKLYIPPVPYHLIHRSELIRGLEEGLSRGQRLTVITAAPGYGKTSLIADWIFHHQQSAATHFCWLSIEESDNDPGQFWTYFLSALQTGRPGLAQSLASSIWAQPNPTVIKTFLIGLVNELTALDVRLVVVLDDFHLIENEAILNELTFLIEHLPSQLHIIFVSRTVPPLPLARWRSRNQIKEIGQAEMHFSLSEAKTFLKAQIVGISDEEIEGIHQQLEGWPAGLQLIAIRSQIQDDPALQMGIALGLSPRQQNRLIPHLSQAQTYLIDYLTEEVLNQLPDPVQAFLLRSSILERFCPSLCEAVLKNTLGSYQDFQALLAHLVKQNLFIISLDPERKWFRYQRLFRDLLQSRLENQAAAEEIQELHRRASAWYQEQGFGAEAVHHALQGNDLPHAADWAEIFAPDFLHNGRSNALLKLLAEFPAEALDSHPLLVLYQARALVSIGQYAAASLRIRSVEQKILAEGHPALVSELAGQKAVLSTFIQTPDETIRFAREALDVLPAENLATRVQMHLVLGGIYRLEAHQPEAVDALLEAQRLARQGGQAYLENTALESLAALRIQAGDYLGAEKILNKTLLSGAGTGFGHVLMGVITLEWDRLAETERYLNDAILLGEKHGVIGVVVNGYLCQSQLRLAQGNRLAAVEALNRAVEATLSMESPGSLWDDQITIERRMLRVRLKGTPDLAYLQGSKEDSDLAHVRLQYVEILSKIVSAREMMAEGHWQEAFSLVQSLEHDCETYGLNRVLVEANVVKAVLYENMGLADQASQEIVRAFRKAMPDRFIRVFVDEDHAVQRLLERSFPLVTSEEAAAIKQLLSHFPELKQNPLEAPPQMQPSTSALVEPLTIREQEVLALIAAGCTNRQIADRLVTTENTIKKHTSHIFEKLMVTNRTQALIRARELGLIS